ncbi:MAG: aldose 1-epimerase [Lachnospiraceae bacterium]|nr:aldose 1-epimerase [Lachnospiraceae bacterium]
MKKGIRLTTFKGETCILMEYDNYRGLLAPSLGSNFLNLEETTHHVRFFHFRKGMSRKFLKKCNIVIGLPTTYLPNRLKDGILRTSDATYQFPVNETSRHNHLHGFLHTRCHKILSMEEKDDCVVAKTYYDYDEKDAFFTYFPLKFRADFTFTLSKEGLRYEVTLRNLSERMLPFGFGTHTTLSCPFIKRQKKKEGKHYHFYLPVKHRYPLNERCLPDGTFKALSEYEEQYRKGVARPVGHDINDELYRLEDTAAESYQSIVTDERTGLSIVNEVSKEYGFYILWNIGGKQDFFCPEPLTWLIDAPNLDLPKEETGYRELNPQESATVWQKFYLRKEDGGTQPRS